MENLSNEAKLDLDSLHSRNIKNVNPDNGVNNKLEHSTAQRKKCIKSLEDSDEEHGVAAAKENQDVNNTCSVEDNDRISNIIRYNMSRLYNQKIVHMTFAGCGFLGVYHLGVVSCLAKHGDKYLQRVEKIAGASAGALSAAILITDKKNVRAYREFVCGLALEIRRKALGVFTPGFRLSDHLETFLKDNLPDDAHITASNKLYISMTNKQSRKNEIHTDFESRDELIQCLISSSFIPLWSGYNLPMFRGTKYFDGGYTDNLPEFKEGITITVSPFHGPQDICPTSKPGSRKVRIKNMKVDLSGKNILRGIHAIRPPRFGTLQKYYDSGFSDCVKFLERENLFQNDGSKVSNFNFKDTPESSNSSIIEI